MTPAGGSAVSKTVLVIDDDEGLQGTLENILIDEGYDVVVAEDGLVALDKMANTTPHLILLDLMMPRMDGFTFAAELERRRLRPGIPIIVLTADGRARQKAAQVGAESYLEKPFDLDVLLDEVARFALP